MVNFRCKSLSGVNHDQMSADRLESQKKFIHYNQRMPEQQPISGVFAAAVTPLDAKGQLDLDSLPAYLGFLANRGCHGALLLGTTGEGPSFAHRERVEIIKSALLVRQEHPEFRLLAGTGTPSLDETVANTHTAFDLGLEGVVVLPPYYYRSTGDEGLFLWFSQLIEKAVPQNGVLLGYHIPPVSGVPLSLTLLSRLKDAYPDRFSGIKDSSGSLEHARQLDQQFGKGLVVFNGNDRLFSAALSSNASGCITAMASLCSPLLRRVWDSYKTGATDQDSQSQLDAFRAIMDKYPPAPPLVKSMLAIQHEFPRWSVKPPLLDMPIDIEASANAELNALRNV
jgi:4-hydroxy-tetrahydrodipicolinate synthase